jgi:hypothetical protein
MNRADLEDKVLEALRHHGGRAQLVDVAKYIWSNYEADLQKSGDFFYVWQYDMRRAAETLRNAGKLVPYDLSKPYWEIK